MIEIIVDDGKIGEVVEAIVDAAYTDEPGDRRIFVIPVRKAYRIRAREEIG